MTVTLWPSLFRPREGRPAPDRAIYARVAAPKRYPAKDAVPRWAGAEFAEGYRCTDAFRRSSWIVLDFDAGPFDIEPFRDFCGIAHTSWSHTPAAPRWRVGLALDRPLTSPAEHDRVWRAAAIHVERAGMQPDYAARTAVHCFALPALGGPGPYEHAVLTGALLDVDEALRLVPAPEPQAPPRAPASSHGLDERRRRASAYLAALPGAISGAGGRVATFRAAVALVRGFALEPDEALAMMWEEFNPRCLPPWTLRELKWKVESAFRMAKMPFGALAEKDRRAR